MADDQTKEVQDEKRTCANEPFHREREKIKREHFEQKVADIGVYRTTSYHCGGLAFPQNMIRPEQAHVDNSRCLKQTDQADADGQNHDERCRYLSGLKHLPSIPFIDSRAPVI